MQNSYGLGAKVTQKNELLNQSCSSGDAFSRVSPMQGPNVVEEETPKNIDTITNKYKF